MSAVITTADLNTELLRVANELREANQRLEAAGHEYAAAEYRYRVGKAQAFQTVRESQVKLLAKEAEALADSINAPAQRDRNLAECNKVAATEAVRSLRSMLSALQSVAASARSESELAGRDF